MSRHFLKKCFGVLACTAMMVVGGQTVSAAPNLAPYAGQMSGEASAPSNPLTLWYRYSAREWTSALPIGNGIQGAMMYGGIDNEVICLNEDTLWAGGPYSPENPDGVAALPEIRKLLLDGKYREADQLISKSMMGKPATQMPYQPVGELHLAIPVSGTVENYIRTLDLSTATATVKYTVDGVTYTRELFASYPDNVMVLRISADKPGKINFKMGMRTEQNLNAADSAGTEDTLILTGSNKDSSGVKAALKFQTRMKILNKGGTLTKGAYVAPAPTATPAAQPAPGGRGARGGGGGGGTRLPVEYTVSNADSVDILIATSTSFKNFQDTSGDPVKLVSDLINKAAAKGVDAIRRDQQADYKKIFDRVTLDLGANADAKLPTDQRIARFRQSNDPALVTLLFQHGRYMLISSSRAGGQAANLQGIWNADMSPMWQSKYTININAEMNYWPAFTANLGECFEPFVKMTEDLQVTGAKTAKTTYNSRGWVAHHNTDIWRASAPIDYPASGMWPMGGVWLSNTAWEQYEFTQDPEVLKRLYPVMKGAATFFIDNLFEEPKTKTLVTGPSGSPEIDHLNGAICYGPTMDMQLLRDLFAHILEGSKALGIDDEFTKKIAELCPRLAPNKIGKGGQLQEWFEDWDMEIRDKQNRHVSHLYGLFPGEDISYYNDKKLADAVKVSLTMRGDGATSWGLGWRLCLWAQLHDGPHAYTILRNLLNPAKANDGGQTAGGAAAGGRGGAGVYNNLFSAHPPFQIDGNFGGVAGIVEMLLQSVAAKSGQPAMIDLLPALAPQWPTGKVTGLRARGNFLVDISWQDGKLVEATIKNQGPARAPVKVMLGDKTITLSLEDGASQKLDGQLVSK